MPIARLTLLVATSNAGKLRDFAAASSSFTQHAAAGILLQPLPGLATLPTPIEDADTFAGNAAIKAIAYSQHAPGQLVLADDSGLEVDSLQGRPGIYSARFAQLMNDSGTGHQGDDNTSTNDARNNACLLFELARNPGAQRTARYRCVLAIARDGHLLTRNGVPIFGHGSTEGVILDQPRGADGFGYDPLFELPNGRTMAEIDLATRLAFSHRTRALADLLPRLFAALEGS